MATRLLSLLAVVLVLAACGEDDGSAEIDLELELTQAYMEQMASLYDVADYHNLGCHRVCSYTYFAQNGLLVAGTPYGQNVKAVIETCDLVLDDSPGAPLVADLQCTGQAVQLVH